MLDGRGGASPAHEDLRAIQACICALEPPRGPNLPPRNAAWKSRPIDELHSGVEAFRILVQTGAAQASQEVVVTPSEAGRC